MKKLKFGYDEEHDIMTIEGLKWSGDLLRALAEIPPKGQFEIVSRDNGVVALKRLD